MLIDKPVPEFNLNILHSDAVLSKSDFPEQAFLLNVWGSYCLPCLAEHPTLMRLSEESEISIVGVNYKDRADLASIWLANNGDPFQFSLYDPDGRFGIDLGVYGAPETYLVDGDGVIRYRHVGVLDETVWQDVFTPLLAELGNEAELL